MRRLTLLLTVILAAAANGQAAQRAATTRRMVAIRIETTLGTIEADLDSAHAPITVTNFLIYVDAHLFDNSEFFRAVTMGNQVGNPVKIEVIQSRRSATAGTRNPPITLERTSVTNLRHIDGTLSMARSAQPNSASDQFFICIGQQPELDFGGKRNPDGQGFAAFGQVTKGMDIVKKIQTQPLKTTGNPQELIAPVVIRRIVRVFP